MNAVRAVTIEDYDVLLFAFVVGSDRETLGSAAQDEDGRRWTVTTHEMDGDHVKEVVTWHTSKSQAERELRVRAGRLVGAS